MILAFLLNPDTLVVKYVKTMIYKSTYSYNQNNFTALKVYICNGIEHFVGAPKRGRVTKIYVQTCPRQFLPNSNDDVLSWYL